MPTIDLTATGLNIKQKMDDKGVSVRDMQDIFGFQTPVALYKWLRGKNLPSIDNLVILAQALDTTIDDILVLH